jgi:hypothetical protein
MYNVETNESNAFSKLHLASALGLL